MTAVPPAVPPWLVLLNGLPGSGKSTLARRWAAAHPPAVVVDVDVVRAGLEHPDPADVAPGQLAREVAGERARGLLLAGRDVLVPQFLARTPFLETLAALAAGTGARFVEVCLDVDLPVAAARIAARAVRAERPEHVLAAELLARAGGPQALLDKHSRMLDLVRSRPGTHVVRTVDGDPDAGYRVLLAVLAR
ncbi:MAG: AAA family ATPase [Actinobacteria bacterium]|nr:AAA family ATPase [Actinomycetota bacterium]